MRNYLMPGNMIPLSAPSPDGCKSGDVLIVGNLAGIAVGDAEAGAEIEVSLVGCYRLAKAAGALTAGTVVTWTGTDKKVATAGAGDLCLGVVIKDAADTDTTAVVRLGGVNVTIPAA
jgi:predicted RecA/RadA family phage recombinase